MTTLQRLQRNLKRADTVNYREQQRGMHDLGVRQTRRMYFAATALSRAAGALAREQRSRRIAAVRADDDDLEAALIQQERDKAGDETEQCPQCGGREYQLLGELGALVWRRCRDCGWDAVIDHHELEGS